MFGLKPEALIGFAVIAAVLVFRFTRMARERPLRPATLWIVPPLLFLLLLFTLVAAPLPPWGYLALGAAMAVGAVIGWHRGKAICIRHDPAENAFHQQSSPLAMLLLAGAIALKVALRQSIGGDVIPDAGNRHHLGALVASSALLGFMVALVSATRIEMALRCRRLAKGETP